MLNESYKLAVVTRSTTSRSQTFVRRHIEFLNGGNTVVVSGRYKGETVMGRPTFHYRNSRLAETLNAAGLFPDFLNRFGASAHNATLTRFFDDQEISHAILEFGYVAAEIGHHVLNTGRPVFCMFRGNDASGMLRRSAYRNTLKHIFPRLSGIICVSQSLADNLAKSGLTHPNTLVVPSGVNTDLFKPGKPESGLCLSVGRMVEKKSPEVMLRAFAKIADKHDLWLEMIGEGDGLAKAKNLTASLGIKARVNFLGGLEHEAIAANMARPAMYLQHFQTSSKGDTEGMPGVIQEAMACGLPIITTRHAGIPDHITDGRNGLLVDEGDVEGFAAAIDRLAGDGALREKLANSAREYAKAHLDYQISNERIERFIGLHD